MNYTVKELIAVDAPKLHQNIHFDATSDDLCSILQVEYVSGFHETHFYSDAIRERWKAKVVLSKDLDNDEKYATKTLVHYYNDKPFMLELLYGRWASFHRYRVFDVDVLAELRRDFTEEKYETADIIDIESDVTDFVHINGRYDGNK